MKKNNKSNPKNNENNKVVSQNNSALDAQLINNLKNKYKVEELSQEHEQVQNQTIQELETKQKQEASSEVVDGQNLLSYQIQEANETGWNNWKVLSKNFLFGIFMGVSDAVPGYSGGTTLSIIGFYHTLIENVRKIFSFKTSFFKVNIRYIVWFLPFLIAWILAFIALNFAVSKASDNNYGIVFVFLFGFFALFSIPLFYIKNQKNLLSYKHLGSQLRSSKRELLSFILMIFAFLLMISFGLMARFIPSTGGVSFLNDSATNGGRFLDPSNFDTNRIILWFIAGYFAGIAMMIPGVSGGIILYVFNVYPQLNYAIANVFNDANFIPYIVIIVISAILGIITSIFVINKITKNWNKLFTNFSFGLVAGSFITIFISLSPADYATLADSAILGVSIAMIFVALIINVVIFVALNEFRMINYPKLRFINKKVDAN